MILLTPKQTLFALGAAIAILAFSCHARYALGQVRVKQEATIVDRADLVRAWEKAKIQRRRAWAFYLETQAEVARAKSALDEFDAVASTLPTPGPTAVPTSTPGHTPSPTPRSR